MEKSKWQKHLMSEWDKEKKKKNPSSFKDVMAKAKSSYRKKDYNIFILKESKFIDLISCSQSLITLKPFS